MHKVKIQLRRTFSFGDLIIATIVTVPAEKVSVRKILKDIFASADVRTWRISSGGTVLTHSQYGGKVHLYKGGHLTISAENNDYEALTLGAFINLLIEERKKT